MTAEQNRRKLDANYILLDGEKIRKLIRMHGLNESRVADAAGVSPCVIRKAGNGYTQRSNAENIAHVFGVGIKELIKRN